MKLPNFTHPTNAAFPNEARSTLEMNPSMFGQRDDVIHGQFPAADGALIRAVNLLGFVCPAEGGSVVKPPRVAGCCLSLTGPRACQGWNYISSAAFDS